MITRWRQWLIALALGLTLTGCGQVATEILESSTILNTTDTKGPYEVKAVILGDRQPFVVTLVYSVDGWSSRQSVEMKKISDQVFHGAIPGQGTGQVIHYYISVVDSDGNIRTEPKDIPENPTNQTYSFRILRID
jgi:hypothetical protein